MKSPVEPAQQEASSSAAKHYARLMEARSQYCAKNGHIIVHQHCKVCGHMPALSKNEEPVYGRTILQLRQEMER